MQTITKQQAATLYGNSYLLQDKQGIKYILKGLIDDMLVVVLVQPNGFESPHRSSINIDKIGVDYHVLARPLDLTKPITHKGETFLPIVELAKIAFPFEEWDRVVTKDGIKMYISPLKKFCFLDGEFRTINLNYKNIHTQNYDILLDKLREWNFALNLPDDSWIPVTDNNNPYK